MVDLLVITWFHIHLASPFEVAERDADDEVDEEPGAEILGGNGLLVRYQSALSKDGRNEGYADGHEEKHIAE